METLGQHQRRFLPLVAKLITYAYSQGYELAGGELYRTPEQAMRDAEEGTGIKNSLHIVKLAIDLLLFKNGVYLKDSNEYAFLGEYWKTLDPECTWGGDFASKDGNHFSLSWGGIR